MAALLDEITRVWSRRLRDEAYRELMAPNALYRHIKTAGASSLDVNPLGSGWDDAMREAAERG